MRLIPRRVVLPILDLFLYPLLFPAAYLMKKVRRIGVNALPRCRSALLRVGVFPITSRSRTCSVFAPPSKSNSTTLSTLT